MSLALATVAAILASALVPWQHTAAWTKTFAGVGLPLPQTLSVQPWVTLQTLGPVAAGALAVVWLWGQAYPPDGLKRLLRGILIILGAMSLIAAFGLAAQLTHPAFPQAEVFSWFANRNQSATLYALTALLGAGLWLIEKRRAWRWSAIAALLAALGALALGPSRGGWLSLVVGAGVLLWGRRQGAGAALGLGVALALAVLAGLPGWESRMNTGLEIRGQLQADAWRMLQDNPAGVGAGNFAAIFPQYQRTPIDDKVVIHPESDWAWWLTELGPLVLLWPLAVGTLRWGQHQRARIVLAIIAAVGAISFFDVPLHRLGILLLLAACLGAVLRLPHRRLLHGTRWMALLPLLVAGLMAAHPLPQLRRQMEKSLRQQDLVKTQAAAAALQAAWPYDVRAYQELGLAQLAWAGRKSLAHDNLTQALTLQPRLYPLAYQAGLAWQPLENARALACWREALRRATATQRPVLLQQIIRQGRQTPAALGSLCGSDASLWATLLQHIDSAAASSLLPTLPIDFWQLPRAEALAYRLITDAPAASAHFATRPNTPWALRALALAQQGYPGSAARLALAQMPARPLQDGHPQLTIAELKPRARLGGSYAEALLARQTTQLPRTEWMNALAAAARLRGATPAIRQRYAQELLARGKDLESWQELRHLLFPAAYDTTQSPLP